VRDPDFDLILCAALSPLLCLAEEQSGCIADGFNSVDESKKILILEPNKEIDFAIRCSLKRRRSKFRRRKSSPPPHDDPILLWIY
jgi:hypothetical protein